MKLNLPVIDLKQLQNNTSSIDKRKGKLFLLNFFSIFQTAMHDCYIPIQTLIFRLLRNVIRT